MKRFFWSRDLLLTIIGILIFTSIAGCGFKLRTQSSFPPQLKTIYFQAEDQYGSLERNIQKELKNSGATFVETPNQAPITLNFSKANFYYRDTTTGPSTQAHVYYLTMTISFKIISKQGQTLLDTQTVSATRNLTLGANEVFEVSSLVDVTKKNMQKELITKIFNLLNSKKVFAVLTAQKQ